MTVPNQAAPAASGVAAPQSNDEAIGSFARGFLGELEKDQDPNQHQHDLEPQADAEAAPPTDAETDAPEPEAETPPEPEVPLVEVEVDGETFKIPEKVKHRVMADKDYRQKTMEVAATRKQLETLTATARKLNEQAQQMAPHNARLLHMESQAEYLFGRLQNDQQLRTDPVEFNRVQGELAILLHNKDRYAQGLQKVNDEFTAAQKKLLSDRLAVEAPALFKEFPEISKPETQQKLAKYVQDEGLPQEAIDFLNYSATGTKLVWKAHQYDVLVKEQAATAKKLQEKQKSTPTATPSSRASETGANTKTLQEGWQRRGGKLTDPAFDQLLRAKLRGK